MAPKGVGLVVLFLATACAPVRAPAPPDTIPESPPPAVVETPAQEPATPQLAVVYSLDEALADALSGPFTHVGTGAWHGNLRAQACAYRNDRVIVVNVFCTIKEPKAFEVHVLSPTRGRVRIYAEGKRPVSLLARGDYFTFNAEAEPPPRARGLAQVALTMSFPELRDYNEKRYRQFLPVCFGGVEFQRPMGGCVRGLEAQATEWAERNRGFLEQPPEGWYRLIRELRAYASLHGKPME